MEHGCLVQEDGILLKRDDHGDVVEVENLGPVVQKHPLGQPGGAAGVHQHHRIGFLGFVGHDRLDRCQQFLVADVVGPVTLADENSVADRAGIWRRGHGISEVLGEESIDEYDLGAGVTHDVVEFGTGQSQVQRVDHPRAQIGSVIQLQELVAVGGHHCETIAGPNPQDIPQGSSQTEHPVAVSGERTPMVPVDDGSPVAVDLDGRQQKSVVDELFHGLQARCTRQRGW